MLNTRTAWALMLLVGLPLLALGFFGVQVMRANQASLFMQHTKMAHLQTQAQLAQLEQAFQSLAANVQQQVESNAQPFLESLRNLAFKREEIDLIAVYQADYQRVFPSPSNANMLVSEKATLAQVEPNFQPLLAQLGERRGQWQWAQATHQAAPQGCWRSTKSTHYYCVLFNSELVAQQLCRDLQRQYQQTPDAQYRLSNGEHTCHAPKSFAPSNAQLAYPLYATPLPAPLQNWQLANYAAHSSSYQNLPLLALLLLMAALLGLLAWFIFSSHRNHIQHMAQRVRSSREMAHDMRTPLSNMLLYAELIEQQAPNNPQIQEYCQVISSEVRRLEALTNSELKRHQAPDTPYRNAVNPADLLRNIVSRYQLLLARADCRLSIQADISTRVYFDVLSWERIIVNLLDNACKYAPGADLRLCCELRPATAQLYLQMCDNGPGISAERMATIWDSAEHAELTPSSSVGLAACRQLARQQGGDLQLQNAEPGLCVSVLLAYQAAE